MQENLFKTQLTVRVGDINYGGHLGNDTVLLYFQEARIRFLAKHGLSEMDIGNNVSITQIESFVRYKAEGFLGDELEIQVIPEEAGKIKFKLEFIITRKDNTVIATGFTLHTGFDYQKRRIAKIPEPFKAFFRHNV